MPIEGPLRELGTHDVFQLLDLSRKTGALRVTSELRHNEGRIYFDSGVVVSAEIRSNPHPLGAMLLRTGKITEADLERARAAKASAELNLSYASVAAPVSGTVAQRRARVGGYARVGEPLLTLVPLDAL